MKCQINASSWSRICPQIFKWIASLGKVPTKDMFRTFNCGIGMVLFVKGENVQQVLATISNALVIGEVTSRQGEEDNQVQINGTPW